MFTNAIVRLPSPSIKDGLTSVNLGKPDFILATKQHSDYVNVMSNLNIRVNVLPEHNSFPDSTFIEDVALCTSTFSVITNPGAESRKGEVNGMRQVLEEYYDVIEEIRSPGTLEGGDVMMVGDRFYIGISERTNENGAEQLKVILRRHGLQGITVGLKRMLHLKSGVSYLENNTLLVCGEFKNKKEFSGFKRIEVDDDASYSANSLWVNGKVLVPEGFPKTLYKIEKAGFETLVIDVSEFRKVDGGLSCLSLRF
jgi:dimethylargininase